MLHCGFLSTDIAVAKIGANIRDAARRGDRMRRRDVCSWN